MMRVFSFPLGAHVETLSYTVPSQSFSSSAPCDNVRRCRFPSTHPQCCATCVDPNELKRSCPYRTLSSSATRVFRLRNQMLSTLLLVVGLVALSLWIFPQLRSTQHVDAALPMFTRCASSSLGQFELSSRSVDSALSQKSKPQLAHGSMHKIALLRRGRCERSHVHGVQLQKEENRITKSIPVTGYI